ncbi:MAG: hypothetical protein KDE68_01410 [Rhodocyclaceae bacterium]|nr:hypothetical protein [Rhodocyclaceae bacterium]
MPAASKVCRLSVFPAVSRCRRVKSGHQKKRLIDSLSVESVFAMMPGVGVGIFDRSQRLRDLEYLFFNKNRSLMIWHGMCFVALASNRIFTEPGNSTK